ncbi:MAG: nitrogenase component 1 [Candidatus Methanoplasma sp.]|jgi:nitrogenase molybdenum-iron protein alpha/beta subunit|nr:nitrogenase component 1 [Candidatus Methanoplasma sp.]
MLTGPDGFIGAVMAIEGISDAAVLLHGPDGCRKNLTVLSNKSYPRPEPGCGVGMPYYRGYPRVPCTGVLSMDYIHGAYEKLRDALDFVKAKNNSFVAVVCSPGASLIGDDCSKAIEECGISDKAIILDAHVLSGPFSDGMDLTIARVIEKLSSERSSPIEDSVNILGLNILTKDWRTAVEEFRTIFELMGLKVICCVGAGSSIEEMRESVNAQYNIVLCPEYARTTASFYLERYGIESISLGYSPVGFDATDDMIGIVAQMTGKDPSKAKEYVDRFRKRAYECMLSGRNDVHGRSFAIEADPSITYPLTKWLFESLSMVPASVMINDTGYEGADELLSMFLTENNLSGCLNEKRRGRLDVILCDGNTAQLEQASGNCRRGIDISFPSIMNTDFRPSPVLGPSGAMYILDRIVNPML